MAHTCRYVLKPFTKDQQAIYCDKPVNFKMGKDDSGNKCRKYSMFCKEHEEKVNEMEDEE